MQIKLTLPFSYIIHNGIYFVFVAQCSFGSHLGFTNIKWAIQFNVSECLIMLFLSGQQEFHKSYIFDKLLVCKGKQTSSAYSSSQGCPHNVVEKKKLWWVR